MVYSTPYFNKFTGLPKGKVYPCHPGTGLAQGKLDFRE
jgi:hypothetical protein